MKKIKLTNSTVLILAGGLFLLIGSIMYVTQGNNNSVVVVKNSVLSQDEANALIIDTTKNIINIYENPTVAFKTEEVKRPKTVEDDSEEIEEEPNEYEDYYLVLNYDEVVNAMFTENGIKELEQTTFEDKKFIVKENDKVYILKEIPLENRYTDSNITINVTKIQNESIASELTLTSYKLDNDDMLTYYAIVKSLSLIKKDNTWLVDGFYYNNK